MQGIGASPRHESFPGPSGVTSQMSRHENAPPGNDSIEGGPPQSSSWKFRQENLRPIRRKFLCDAYREVGGPQELPTPPTEREKLGVISFSKRDTAILAALRALNQLPFYSGQGQPNETPHQAHSGITNEQGPEESQAQVTQGNQRKQGPKGKGKTPLTKEQQKAKDSRQGISKASTAPQTTGLASRMQQNVDVGPSSYHDMDARMCPPQGQSINQGTQGQPNMRLAHDQFRTPAPSVSIVWLHGVAMQRPQRSHFHAQPPKRDFRRIFPDLNPTWFNDEGLIQLPPLRRRPHDSPPNPPSDIGVPKPQFDPTTW
ncbi:hypothetical protein BGX38DRAFT_423897 [Terfezia claveryi]|nr:hypothetical protein BGX38DRAFT_423897 [Terfezia claveryi]